MPQKQTFKLPPLDLGDESLGQRIARLRKIKGYTQTDLAKEMAQGNSSEREIRNIRVLISDYERNRLKPNYEMIARISIALEVTTDELIGLKSTKIKTNSTSLKIMRRIKRIEALPPAKQNIILKNIDIVINGVEAKK